MDRLLRVVAAYPELVTYMRAQFAGGTVAIRESCIRARA